MSDKKQQPYIKVTKDGPYLVFGVPKIVEEIITADSEGISMEYAPGKPFDIKHDPVALCRCGASKTAPFCDGSHTDAGFDGTETASFEPILKRAESFDGPNLTLRDNQDYCAFARFCDAHGRIWNLVYEGDATSDAHVVREAHLCPAGRLMVFDKSGRELKPNDPQMISVLQDKGLRISGPLWIKGSIRVESADGKSYEVRSSQTLCRCGASGHKPFCNGAHASARWKDSLIQGKKKEDWK